MELLTQELREQLLANGRQQQPLPGSFGQIDFLPVVKLFLPKEEAIWLLTEIDPNDPDRAFGLLDLGIGLPALGSISLEELAMECDRFGELVERDLDFTATKTLSAYADEATRCGYIRA